MDQQTINQFDAFDRVVDFGGEHPLTPPLASVTALMTGMGTVVTAIVDYAENQDIGRGGFHAGTTYRQSVAEQLRELMRPVAAIARVLNPVTFAGVSDQFRMPASHGYPILIARAEAFVSAIAPIKQEFVDRGLPETFDTELSTKQAELVAATAQKNAGKAIRMAGTANLKAKAREGMRILRELDAILSYQYRNNPGLLAAWKGACRVQRAASAPAPATPPPQEPPAGS